MHGLVTYLHNKLRTLNSTGIVVDCTELNDNTQIITVKNRWGGEIFCKVTTLDISNTLSVILDTRWCSTNTITLDKNKLDENNYSIFFTLYFSAIYEACKNHSAYGYRVTSIINDTLFEDLVGYGEFDINDVCVMRNGVCIGVINSDITLDTHYMFLMNTVNMKYESLRYDLSEKEYLTKDSFISAFKRVFFGTGRHSSITHHD